jgi:hypothetical protein
MQGAALKWTSRSQREEGLAGVEVRSGFWRLLRRLDAWLRLLRHNLADRSTCKPPWPRHAALLGRGLLSSRDEEYGPGFVRCQDHYLHDLARLEHGGRLNAPFGPVLAEKLLFWGMLRGFSDAIAPVTAVAHGGLLTRLEGPRAGTTVPLALGLETLEGCYVFKSPRGSMGRWLFFFEQRDGMARVDGVDLPMAALARLFARCVLIACPFVQQADYAQTIFPHAGNSIRLVTMYDGQRREAFLAAACHRFGRAGAVSVADNWNHGGLTADLDSFTGVLGKAVWTEGYRRAEGAVHPDTGARIAGVEVPGWSRIRDGILDLAGRVPFLPHVGWDVIATGSGFSILEGNGRPSLTISQTFRPLLADPRVRRFLQHRGII